MWRIPSFMFTVYLVIVFITIFDRFDAKKLNGEKAKYCKYGHRLIKEGDSHSAPIGECRNIKCLNATHNSISAVTCPIFHVEADHNCTITDTDLTKPYPDCCPTVTCAPRRAE